MDVQPEINIQNTINGKEITLKEIDDLRHIVFVNTNSSDHTEGIMIPKWTTISSDGRYYNFVWEFFLCMPGSDKKRYCQYIEIPLDDEENKMPIAQSFRNYKKKLSKTARDCFEMLDPGMYRHNVLNINSDLTKMLRRIVDGHVFLQMPTFKQLLRSSYTLVTILTQCMFGCLKSDKNSKDVWYEERTNSAAKWDEVGQKFRILLAPRPFGVLGYVVESGLFQNQQFDWVAIAQKWMLVYQIVDYWTNMRELLAKKIVAQKAQERLSSKQTMESLSKTELDMLPSIPDDDALLYYVFESRLAEDKISDILRKRSSKRNKGSQRTHPKTAKEFDDSFDKMWDEIDAVEDPAVRVNKLRQSMGLQPIRQPSTAEAANSNGKRMTSPIKEGSYAGDRLCDKRPRKLDDEGVPAEQVEDEASEEEDEKADSEEVIDVGEEPANL